MKKLVMTVFLFAQIVHGNKDYELFLQGNQLSKSGQYNEALATYESIKTRSSVIFYNTGLVQYALGSYGQALACFRQAQLTVSGQLYSKVEEAVEVVQNKLGLPHDSLLYNTLLYFQSDIWLGWYQCIFLILLLGLLWEWYRSKKDSTKIDISYEKKQRDRNKLITKVLIIVGLCRTAVILFAYYYIHQPYAIVVAKEAPVFVGPNKEFDTVAVVPEGLRLELVDENDAWCKMHCRISKGWVQKEHVLIIEAHN
jgi:tetratricopeptide (TPR) repeat protein